MLIANDLQTISDGSSLKRKVARLPENCRSVPRVMPNLNRCVDPMTSRVVPTGGLTLRHLRQHDAARSPDKATRAPKGAHGLATVTPWVAPVLTPIEGATRRDLSFWRLANPRRNHLLDLMLQFATLCLSLSLQKHPRLLSFIPF